MLDRNVKLATGIAYLTSGAEEKLIDHCLVKFFPARQDLSQVGVFTTEGMGFPTTARELLTSRDTVTATSTGCSEKGNTPWNTVFLSGSLFSL